MEAPSPVAAGGDPASRAACLFCGPASGYRTALDGVLRECRACGFRWTAAAAEPAEQLYDAAYFAGAGYAEYFLPAPRRFEAARRLRWLTTLARPATLLEAGSAGGFFVAAARAAGIEATGVEVSAVAARHARDILDVPVRHGTFESVARGLPPVDAVCAFHVLEHVDDPRVFLAAARAALLPGGWLALEVPNIASGGARRRGVDWPGLQPRYHRWHFDPRTLTDLVAACGFRVVGRDTTVFRYYQPARYRWRHARHLFPHDLLDTRSPLLTHARRGDLLRLVARRQARPAPVRVRRTVTAPGGTACP